MANEELIYQITRAVYGQLGASADEKSVEQLVTEIYRSIEPLVGAGPRPQQPATVVTDGAAGSSSRLVISVFGVDHPGIVAAIAQILASADCSIIDINQTVVRGKFAMVIIADVTRSRENVSSLKDRFRNEGARLGVRIYAQREDLFNAMHRI